MNTAAVRDNWVGRLVDGRFTLLRWLGGSESSDVFLTELQGQGSQKAAIKLIPTDDKDAEAHIAGWAVAASLSHPHLMHLFNTGRCQIDAARRLYAVMDYAEEDLSQIIPERPLTPAEAREMLLPVVDALSYLHKRGVVHGRLRPSNIMVVDNQLKLSCDLHTVADFGKHLRVPSVYDAPEVATGEISPAADVWSLGVTLIEALTQHPPLWDISSHREPEVPEPIPQPLAGIARECLRSEPALRCTLSEIKARLESARCLPEPGGKRGGIVPAKLGIRALMAAIVLLAVVAATKLGIHWTPPLVLTGKQQPASVIGAPPRQSPAPSNQSPKSIVVKGAVVERALPSVPRSAGKTIQGRVSVRIQVTVDPSGDVSDVKIATKGPSKYFANLALQAARHWRFKPAQVDGQAVSSVWILRFQFGQTATDVTPVEATP
jgi:TonB family protein